MKRSLSDKWSPKSEASVFFPVYAEYEDNRLNDIQETTSAYGTPIAIDTSMDNDDNEYQMKSSDNTIEIIDLVSANNSPENRFKSVNYISKTLNLRSYQRISILPMFPTINQQSNVTHLFANIPQNQLSIDDQKFRRRGRFESSFKIDENSNANDSFMLQQFDIYFRPLISRLHVDLVILDYNYARMQYFIECFHNSRKRILGSEKYNVSTLTTKLSENEYPLLLEFFLQIDVDLFYMKTCTFRQAQPRSTTEGLFCQQLPSCRYTMSPCRSCRLCSKAYSLSNRQEPTIKFEEYERHRFVNGYESILNAPATCSTTNFIYVLTCPCNEYDFIGETTQTLEKRLIRHRELGNRILHLFLIGELNRQSIEGQPKNHEVYTKARMRLYQHSTQCRIAMKIFIDANPQYSCFIPILEDEANRQDLQQNELKFTRRSTKRDPTIEQRLNYLPSTPYGYRFSIDQQQKQYEFFQMKMDKQPPKVNLDLYNAKIICLLPPYATDLFRQMVHSMFVTHCETKLNTLGHLFNDIISSTMSSHAWCSDVIGRQ